ncbi:TetR/AcrR family transcriptional regulator [Niallia oryzisoli]|uniref:TetR/AcrR family transcriptional regulator n=1 Tax=Niallia oryzisoli TaxID=1737571 RepID=A0ABZ2C8X6_9BACI
MSNHKKVKVDPRILRTKRMFKEALISLLTENVDKSKLTVQKIAERSELNRATFYLHYRDIEDLMEQMTDEILGELSEKINPHSVENPSKGYPPLVSFLEHIYQHGGLFHVMLENKDFRTRIFNILLEIITLKGEEKMAKGNPFLVPTEIMASSTLGIVTWWVQAEMPYSPSYLAKQIILMYSKKKE